MSERFPHDAAYKAFFSDPAMVESLLRDFVPEDFIDDLDFSTLERCSGSYVTDDLRERHDDIIWRISWKKDKWCYAVLLLEFQRSQDHWMALRILSYRLCCFLISSKQARCANRTAFPRFSPSSSTTATSPGRPLRKWPNSSPRCLSASGAIVLPKNISSLMRAVCPMTP